MSNQKNNSKSAIDLLEAANQESFIYEQFKIPIGNTGEFIDAILHAPDMFQLQRAQKEAYSLEYARLKRKGFAEEEYNDADWNTYLKSINDTESKKRALENPPENLADQLANQNALHICILDMMPRVLKDVKTGDLLFPDEKSRERFKNLLTRDMKLFKLVSDKYVQAINGMIGLGDQLKNSESGTNSETGSSKKVSQDDTE